MNFQVNKCTEIRILDSVIANNKDFVKSDLDQYIFVTEEIPSAYMLKSSHEVTCMFYNATTGRYYGYCRVKLSSDYERIIKIIKYSDHYSNRGKISCIYHYDTSHCDYVHRIVYAIWLYFKKDNLLLNPKLDINHKSWDGEDNTLSNLEAVSHSDNCKHAQLGVLFKKLGINPYTSPVPAIYADMIRMLLTNQR